MNAGVRGLMPILATPFHRSGELDLDGLARIVEFELESGVDAVAVFGMASEGFALTVAERRTILRLVREIVDGSMPVIAGVNGTSTATAIEQAKEAEAGGADVIMVIPPYMVKPPAGTLLDFYGELAAATDLSIMVQDAPGMTGVTMTASTIAELGRIDGIDSVKVESPPTAPKVGQIAEATAGTDFVILGGQNAQFCLEEYGRGAVGTMPACEFSDLLAVVLRDWNAGNTADARLGFQRLLPLILFGLQPGLAWAVHKEVLVERGLIADPFVRYPGAQLDAGSRKALGLILDELGLPGRTERIAL